MTARTRSRTGIIGAAVAALLMPLALVATLASPASAAPGRPHEVYMYKVEKHVDLSGEFPDNYLHEHVYCNPGDWALDGMWRVDHVDQANPPDTFGDERDVIFTASYGDDVDRTEWHFRAHNYADGDAQLKLFVTCIRGTVENAYGHSHNVVVSSRFDDTRTIGPAVGTANYEFYHGTTCPSGSIAVAPGFRFSKAAVAYDDSYGRIFRSWPASATYRSWYWAFQITDADVDVDLYLRCLQIKTGPGGNGPHAHNLLWAYRDNGYSGSQKTLTTVGMQERRLSCDDGADGKFFQDYKAMVGAFYIPDPNHIWYLGQDPRPKTRAYRFWWDGDPSFKDVYLTALCIRARTGKQIAP